MANIKQIKITGRLPFNCCEYKELQPFLAQFLMPNIGIKIQWRDFEEYIPNQHGGKTKMYDFAIFGEEAVNSNWIAALKGAVVECEGGRIDSVFVKDIENNVILTNW